MIIVVVVVRTSIAFNRYSWNYTYSSEHAGLVPTNSKWGDIKLAVKLVILNRIFYQETFFFGYYFLFYAYISVLSLMNTEKKEFTSLAVSINRCYHGT